MNIRKSDLLSLFYIISFSPYLISSYGFFYNLRPYLYLLVFIVVLFDFAKNIHHYKRDIFFSSKRIIPLILLLTVEFISVFYSYNKFISIQLFAANIFIVSILLIYIPSMKREEIYRFSLNIVFINAFLYALSVLLLIFNYRLATVTRFGFYTFSGVFYAKQIGILSLITIFAIDIARDQTESPDIKLKNFLNITYVFSILFIILSFYRSAFMALLIYWGILITVNKEFRRYLIYYIPLLLLLATIFIFKPLNNIIKYTVTDRQYFINYAFHIYKHYFIKGNGYGCGKFLTLLPEASSYLRHDLMGKQFHNAYIEIYFDLGFPGLFFFLWMIFAMLRNSIRHKMTRVVIISILILFINLFHSSLAYPSSLSYFFSYFIIIYGLLRKEPLS
ncbi:MAG: hypothetical protein GWP03_01555 [Proteobacteria bacterium]|nr:hypothetical protein [Pseudomonadota bacterium]